MDVIRSRRCVAPFCIYRDCEDNTLLNLTRILQACLMGKSYLILVRKVLVFCHNLTCDLNCFRAFQPVEILKLAMEKIIVKWTEGRSKEPYFYNDNSNDPCDVFLDPSALLLGMKFAVWFPPFST